jgi:hypothetical protein
MKVLYRFSDGGYNKIKPSYVTKRGCLLHFLQVFKNYDIYLFADNVTDETFQFLKQHIDESKIYRTSLNNAGSFMNSLRFAINNFDDNEKIYFAEDDYIYLNEAPQIIEEGLDIADYSSGYDHPDKYVNHNEGGPNPFIVNGGELTRVILSKSRHWKVTNSCCMTFATTVKKCKEDYRVFESFCSTNHPYDFQIFCELYKKGRKLVSCIPAVSTHGETQWLSKFIDWEKTFTESAHTF